MRISTLWYTFKQGFKNIFRNKIFSLATIATISSCIFLFGLFYCLVINVQYSVKAAQSASCRIKRPKAATASGRRFSANPPGR